MYSRDNWNLNPHYQSNQPVKPDQFGSLFNDMKASIRAVQQQKLSKTDEVKKDLLSKFRKDGLHAEHLVNFRLQETDGMHSMPFVQAAALLFDDYHLKPDQVVAELNGLYFYQAFALRDCYAKGLRGEHLRSWKKGAASEFYLNHWHALVWLMNDKGIAPEKAVRLLDNQASADIDVIKKVALQRLEQLAAPAGMTAKELLAQLAQKGWQEPEEKLKKRGLAGVYTADDLVACTKYCWEIPKYITDQRPELISQMTAQHIIDMFGAGPSGGAAVLHIFGSSAEKMTNLNLTAAQFKQLTSNLLKFKGQGISIEDTYGKHLAAAMMQKIAGLEDEKTKFCSGQRIKYTPVKPSAQGMFAESAASVARQSIPVVPPAPPSTPVVSVVKPPAPHYKDEDDGRFSSPPTERFRF